MRVADNWKDYELIDCSCGERLERWGNITLIRPDPQVIWKTEKKNPLWKKADAVYHRSQTGGGQWEIRNKIPDFWTINYRDLTFNIKTMGFKHTGLFPEQATNWDKVAEIIKNAGREVKVLNLFAYTGGASIAACAGGAAVTHVDSVKQVVTWARENMELSGLKDIRWIVEDALKFVKREVRREKRYDGLILDPPAYGRGTDGERWVLEKNIDEMLHECAKLLSDKGFLVLNLYSMGLSPLLARTLAQEAFGQNGECQFGELYAEDRFGKSMPMGVYCRIFRK